MKNIVFLALLGSFLTILTGCGGGSGTPSTQILPLQKGYVLDSPISGLDFECGDIAGVTNDKGMFECRKFPVTFKIGNLTIGTVSKMPSDKKVYPQDIIGKKRTNFTDAKVIELTRFLQSLDDDGNIDKTIKITPSIKKSFTTKQTLSTLSENSQKALVEEAGKTYVTKQSAMTHLKDNIEKLTSIMITPTTTTIELGKTAIFKAEGSFSTGVKKDITSQVIWSSSNPAIATMTSKTATAKSVGTSTIKATYKGKSKTATLTVTEASLISLDINATDTEIAEGTQTKLSAKGTFADETTTLMTTQVTWSSSDTTKATVDATGTVKALVKGTVVITAKKDDITATKTIMISDAELTAIEVTPQTQSIAKGLTGQVIVTGTYTNGQTQTLASGVDFNSSDVSVATVDATGKVTTLKEGTATINAKSGLFTTQTTITVTPAILSSIKINPLGVANIAKGKTAQLSVTGTYSDKITKDVSSQVTWSSVTSSLAIVSVQGLLTTVRLGTAKIKATVGTFSDEVSIVVSDAELVSIEMQPSAMGEISQKGHIAKGLSDAVSVQGLYTDGSKKNIQATFTSSDIAIVTISLSGAIVANNEGKTIITASSEEKNTTIEIEVTPAILSSINIEADKQTIFIGETTQLVVNGVYSDRETKDILDLAEISTNNSYLSVNNSGLVITNTDGSGHTIITATLDGKTAQTTINFKTLASQFDINVYLTSGNIDNNVLQNGYKFYTYIQSHAEKTFSLHKRTVTDGDGLLIGTTTDASLLNNNYINPTGAGGTIAFSSTIGANGAKLPLTLTYYLEEIETGKTFTVSKVFNGE